MIQPSESIKEFARQVLDSLPDSGDLLEQSPAEAEERAFDGLRRRLGKVLGTQGFRAVLARSLALARREASWLNGVQVGPDGELIGLEDAAKAHESMGNPGFVSLLAYFLELLTSLIGEELTGRLLYDVWPDVPFGQSSSGTQEVDG